MTESPDSPNPHLVEQRRFSDWVAERSSFLEIRLGRMSAELKTAKFAFPLKVDSHIGGNAAFQYGNGVAVYEVGYRFAARDAEKKVAWEVSFAFALSFAVGLDAQPDDEHLQAFGNVAVLEIAHPYARELLHNVTARMGVAPFVLEVLGPNWLRPAPP